MPLPSDAVDGHVHNIRRGAQHFSDFAVPKTATLQARNLGFLVLFFDTLNEDSG